MGRVLKPGGRFACFDVMLPSYSATNSGSNIEYPLPFASDPSSSFLSSSEEYNQAFLDARCGFSLIDEEERLGYVIETLSTNMEKMKGYVQSHGGQLPPLTLALVMGPTFKTKMKNILKM